MQGVLGPPREYALFQGAVIEILRKYLKPNLLTISYTVGVNRDMKVLSLSVSSVNNPHATIIALYETSNVHAWTPILTSHKIELKENSR